MKKIIYVILSLSVIFGCKHHTAKNESIRQEPKSAFTQYFHSNFKELPGQTIDGYKLDSVQWVGSFYKYIDNIPVWITDSLTLSDKGQQLIELLTTARNHGLQTHYYPTTIVNDLANKLKTDIDLREKEKIATELEPLLSYSYMLFGMHLNNGVLSSIDSLTVLPKKKFTIDMPNYFSKAYKADSLMDKLLSLQPGQVAYHNLQKALQEYLKNTNLSTNSVEVIPYKEDSLQSIGLAKKALELHGYLSGSSPDSVYEKALKYFQRSHGLNDDGVVGNNTAKALSLSPYEYYLKILAAMERWRWKDTFNGYYLYANIPSYRLQLIENENIVKEFKTVVGNYKNETPEIADTLEYIIAYPNWHVPRRIAVEEILLKAKKDSTYLQRNNFDIVSRKKETIDPASIDWADMDADNFNYSVRQRGGGYNSLGYIKFIFPNKHAIYLHDTPTKYQFELEKRAYSHGCVRVKNALDLAGLLLEKDGNDYTLDSVKAYIERKKEKAIGLKHKLPIYIYYMPTVADASGNLIFYDDVYGLDKKLIKLLIDRGN